ncbi:MAG: DnaJ domain-containing protein [Acidobacteria bacterium]|nr:DnaJ domain-containing protein [Acidobacteriota bacterium]
MPQRETHIPPDWYAVLGVAPSATIVEIRAAYRRRARVLHAERMQFTAPPRTLARAYDRLQAVSDAYRVLRHPETRRAYDLACHTRPASAPEPELTVQPARAFFDSVETDKRGNTLFDKAWPLREVLDRNEKRSQPRHDTQGGTPARSQGDRRRTRGRIAVVIAFGLLVLVAVAINIAERRQVEASMLSGPPGQQTGAVSEP